MFGMFAPALTAPGWTSPFWPEFACTGSEVGADPVVALLAVLPPEAPDRLLPAGSVAAVLEFTELEVEWEVEWGGSLLDAVLALPGALDASALLALPAPFDAGELAAPAVVAAPDAGADVDPAVDAVDAPVEEVLAAPSELAAPGADVSTELAAPGALV